MDIRFLIQLTDGGGKDFTAPESLGDVLHTPDRYACQVHLDERLFYTALPAAITLNNGSLKRDFPKFWYFEGDIPGNGGEIPAIVTDVVALALFIALVPSRLGKFLGLGLQQLVERFFYTSTHKCLELALDNILI